MPTRLNRLIKTPKGRDTLYSGEVNEHGQPHGYGEWVIISKDEFEGRIDSGTFENGVFQGVGKVVSPNGQKGTGEWVKSLLDGVGLLEYPSGSRYHGQLKGGKKHGFGTLAYGDGRMFWGFFAEDKIHGAGLWIFADGSKSAVTCQHDKVVSENRGLMNHDACTRT
jgi:hypothetical protein